ncbi:MAG TPA: TerB family tellurite resistance protein [Polyangiales bacterium]
MLFKWLLGDKTTSTPTASGELRELVAKSLPEADEKQASIVGSVAGLLATVAHADRNYTEAERKEVTAVLSRVHSLEMGALGAIEELLAERIAALSAEPLQGYTRVLYEGLTREARAEIFEALMDLAAADEVLDMHETNLLRRIARGLGLSDQEYVASQQRHRHRLSVLKPS